MWNQFFPPCLLFHISLTSFSLCSIRPGYGQLGLFDGFCPIRCSGDQMSALSGSSPHCPMMNSRQWALLLLSFFLSHVPTAALPGRSKTNAIAHKSIYNGLIMQKIQLFLYSLCVDYKDLLDVFALFRLIKSTWGWKLYVSKLGTVLHTRPFIQARSSLRICMNVCSAHVVFSFRPDWEPPPAEVKTMSQVGGSECGESQHSLDK